MSKSADLKKDLNNARYVKARVLVASLKARYWPGLSKDSNIVGAAFADVMRMVKSLMSQHWLFMLRGKFQHVFCRPAGYCRNEPILAVIALK